MSLNLLSLLVVFSTLGGFCLSLCLLRHPRIVQAVTCMAVAISFGGLLGLWFSLKPDLTFAMKLCYWLKVGKLKIFWGLCFNDLNFAMTGVVTFISFWVHIYSLSYMANDPHRARFMAYLNFFTFMMLLLITSPTLIQMFVGWEGVGVASYLLIGFWGHREKTGPAAMKAFLVNRVGDAAMLLGICALLYQFGTLEFSSLATQIPGQADATMNFWFSEVSALNLIGLLFFIGAMAKSAQIGFHVWLPDAMEAPTPVSALIHAATMVTAGIFLLAKLSPLYECAPYVRNVMIVVGALTALFGAVVALTQTDIKRIIAYSTCSQLGYMVLACGCSAYKAAIFHLVTHAFFKALLFLGAGSVIHAMSGEQDIRKMGGLARFIPTTCGLMWIGSLALGGIPFLSGYYSKDWILYSLWEAGSIGGLTIALFVITLTTFYSWRLLWLVFQGQLRADDQVEAHLHESPLLMLIPLFVLASGAVVSGWCGWHLLLVETTHSPLWLELIPFVLAVSGILGAIHVYRHPNLANKLGNGLLYQFSYRKGYFDEIYKSLLTKPILQLGTFFWRIIDVRVIDRFGPEASSKVLLFFSGRHKILQNGYLSRYTFIMMLAILLILGYYLVIFYNCPGFSRVNL
ncbi:NADH-quinone oxidoreductase subunit L [Candidatus Finniella inopinata]|uniref:NADH-ubiquinone oxidoreductase chain 5 n=1 Tax=Candidatus Finniella inopinata TaxID=1696036 RepID=A0A4V2DZS8_9PROT|nr:NADH-quinone oxidoreductase subunit L [Candidatus Finniella inopinata]RZI46107.1 NADH-quinone oxidoreductase subunit L [Candidatus Finniella inopinata]